MNVVGEKAIIRPFKQMIVNYQKPSKPDGEHFDDCRFSGVDWAADVDGLVVVEGHEHGVLSPDQKTNCYNKQKHRTINPRRLLINFVVKKG